MRLCGKRNSELRTHVKRALEDLLVPSIPIKLVRGSETGRPDDLFLDTARQTTIH
jgi:hypothetical protein